MADDYTVKNVFPLHFTGEEVQQKLERIDTIQTLGPSSSGAGLVSVDGETITVDENGEISAHFYGLQKSEATPILSASGWNVSTQAQKVEVSNLSVYDTVIVAPNPNYMIDYCTYGIYCQVQETNYLTFRYQGEVVPPSSITVNILILKDTTPVGV